MKPIYILFILLLSLSAAGQNELPTGKIEVVKDFEVRLTETKKIRIIPKPVTLDTSMRRYEYKLSAQSPAIRYEVPQLMPLAIEPEQQPAYYPLFAKAGYGSPNSLLGMLSYERQLTDLFSWGIDFRHLSANNKNIPLQKFSDSQARINSSLMLNESVQLDAYLDGHFESVYFYGAEEIPSNPESLKKSFTRYDANFILSNTPEENPLVGYSALLQYLFDKDDLGSRERGFRLGGDAHVLIGEAEFPIGLKILADLSRLKDTEEKSLNNILIGPYFKYHTGGFKIQLGGIALINERENEILPNLEVSYNLFPLVTLRLGWEGEVVKNNFHYLSSYNPYLITRLDSIGNMISRRIYGGVNGISGIFNYEVTGAYTKFKNMSFFLQDFSSSEQFRPVYDDGSHIGIEGALYFDVLTNITLRGDFFARFYSLDNEEKPWHRPSLGIDAQVSYSGSEDVYHVSLVFHGENGLPYMTPGGTVSTIEPLIDLNLHADYYFTKSLGAFVQLNNLFGNKRERWKNYPSFGFNAKAGVMLRL